jgi:deoxyribodipyrimidine photo-lyase
MPTNKPYRSGLMWFRRDLRCNDNTALHQALRQCERVYVAFVFDRAILDPLPRQDRRVGFIHASVLALDRDLRALSPTPGVNLIVRHAHAEGAIADLAVQLGVDAVFANEDYEPEACARDERVRSALSSLGVAFHLHKDQVVFAPNEIRTQQGKPYFVFTPFKKAWLARLTEEDLEPRTAADHAASLAAPPPALQRPIPSLAEMGFEPPADEVQRLLPGSDGATQRLRDFLGRIGRYDALRDYPALKGPSYLSVHLRFGTISIRELVAAAQAAARTGAGTGATTWLSELVWREFYFQILGMYPHVVDHSFKPEYDRITWETGAEADAAFDAWCQGQTGYPLVDAGMRQLNQTGYLHNRLRMVTASFLVKNLGIDWRRGERYFAARLNDYDLAANNGGWQWCASTGCDAQPWFRIFNPVTQSERFDPEGRFIRRYVPEIAQLPNTSIHAPWKAKPVDLAAADVRLGIDYPAPIVAHEAARERTLARYAAVRGRQASTVP